MGDKMFEYIIGKITDINPGYIVIENNNIGYKIYTSNDKTCIIQQNDII